jgi:hypothetical protein
MRVTMKANFKQAAGQIDAWSHLKMREVEDTVNESALNIQKGAKRRCAVNLGRLRSSIAVEPASGPGINLRVGTKVFYAPYVEWGTGIFAEHPTIKGRQTPWAFPIPKSGKKYGFKQIEGENGDMLYLTRGSKPHPFLLPAFEDERPAFLAALKGVLSK